MRIVVTGASGFLGAAAAAELRRRGVTVTTVARTGSAVDLRVSDYADAPSGDVLVHLAQDADRGRVNRLGASAEREAAQVLAALLGKRYRRVVYVSSAALYGDESERVHPVGDPLCINDSYTRIKAASEAAVLSAPDSIVLRMANAYGPGMSRSSVVGAVLRQVPGDGDVEIFDPEPVRDFIWYADAASAIAIAALGAARGIYNVGTGIGTAVGTLAQILLQHAGEEHRPIKATRPSGRTSHLVVDPATTRADLGWNAHITLAHGLKELLGSWT